MLTSPRSSLSSALLPGLALLGIVLATALPASGQQNEADPAANAATLKLLTTFRQEFVPITPGKGVFPRSFSMGSQTGSDAERPPHRVTLDYHFEMASYEVPQNLWLAVMGENPSRWKGPRNSVEMVSYDQAVAFCQKTARLLRQAKLIEPSEIVRLPSEAEWEYCARADSRTRYSFGNEVGQLDAYAWHTGNAAGNDPPVGAKKPNAWQLYDMHGYLWEWCADDWHNSYRDAPSDGTAWIDSPRADRRTLRSGSWKDRAEQLTSSFRRAASPRLKDDAVGLRCVLSKLPANRPPDKTGQPEK